MTTYFLLKILLSSFVLAAVSELGKRSTLTAAILASLPLTSLLALTWLYLDTGDTEKVASLSMGIFWVVVPSLVFFVVFASLMRMGLRFPIALPASCLVMAATYAGYVWALSKIGVRL